MTSSEPSITEAQAALDDVRLIVDNVPFEMVKAVEPLLGLEDNYYRVRFYQGAALSVQWLRDRETFKEAVRNALLRYFTSDGSDKFADHG
jgi:hypothetical protein